MDKKKQITVMDQFLDEILKVAIERISEAKPWKERESDQQITVDKKRAAKYLGLSASTIDTLLKDNKIPCIRPSGLGGRVYFRLETLNKWMTTLEKESLKSIDDLSVGNGYDYKVG